MRRAARASSISPYSATMRQRSRERAARNSFTTATPTIRTRTSATIDVAIAFVSQNSWKVKSEIVMRTSAISESAPATRVLEMLIQLMPA
jgi:hypothetical protein